MKELSKSVKNPNVSILVKEIRSFRVFIIGRVVKPGVYPLKPGMAKVYNEGDVHSPKREGSTRLIRIEGTNMDKVKRLTYEKV